METTDVLRPLPVYTAEPTLECQLCGCHVTGHLAEQHMVALHPQEASGG
jgi:tetrahydromethanopterin S-methyltransferase subunit A